MSNKRDGHEAEGYKPTIINADEPMSILERNRGKFDFVLLEHDVVEANTKLIRQLHDEFLDCLTVGLEKAIQIGGLLFEQKKRIRHGYFTRWAVEYLPLTIRTAQNYMKLYHYREMFRQKEITTISDAYAALKGESTPEEVIEVNDSIDVSSKPMMVDTRVDLDNMTLPTKKAKGRMGKIVIDEEVISRIKNEDYPFDQESKGKYVKIVIEIRKSCKNDVDLLGESLVAMSSLLKSGGKIIFLKK